MENPATDTSTKETFRRHYFKNSSFSIVLPSTWFLTVRLASLSVVLVLMFRCWGHSKNSCSLTYLLTYPRWQRTRQPRDLDFWPFDLKVNECRATATRCASTEFGVNSSSPFSFIARTHPQSQTPVTVLPVCVMTTRLSAHVAFDSSSVLLCSIVICYVMYFRFSGWQYNTIKYTMAAKSWINEY